jgi:hypothetical protein
MEIYMLPRAAKLYVALVLASGLATLLLAAGSWSMPVNLKPCAVLLALAALASTLKIRIPGVESTLTPNFIFLLLAVNVCRFSEVVTIALVAAVIQCVWRSAKRPRLVQVAFSAAALVLSIAAAYQLSHLLLATHAWDSSIARVILAGSIYFPLNSALVAVVIGLASGQSFQQICSRGEATVFPYFMGGIIFAALATSGYGSSSSWQAAVILIPAVILAHLFFRNRSTGAFAVKTTT